MRTLKFQRKKSDNTLEPILEVDVLTPNDLTGHGLVKREVIGDVVDEISVPELNTYFDFTPPHNGLLVASVHPNPETEALIPSKFSVTTNVGGVSIPLLEEVAANVGIGSTWESAGNMTWDDVGSVREPFSNSLPVTKGQTYQLLAATEYVKFYYIANKEEPLYFGDISIFNSVKTINVDPFQTTGILPVLFSSYGLKPITSYTPIITVEWLKPFIKSPYASTIVQDVRPEGFNILFLNGEGELATGMFVESERNLERAFTLRVTIQTS